MTYLQRDGKTPYHIVLDFIRKHQTRDLGLCENGEFVQRLEVKLLAFIEALDHSCELSVRAISI